MVVGNLLHHAAGLRDYAAALRQEALLKAVPTMT